jgi:SAM-dependent methyltransferase
VNRETGVHGAQWGGQYEGYFGSRKKAQQLIEAIEQCADATTPTVIVDLGGGTGFLLDELIQRQRIPSTARLINMDLSERQLEQVRHPRIMTLQNSFMEFLRQDVATGDDTLMLFTRSTLHYAGVLGQLPTLRHIREQLLPGECFIQQTLAIDEPEDALLVDELIERMHSSKWITPFNALIRNCRRVGFDVIQWTDAPVLNITDTEFSARYHVPVQEMQQIRDILQKAYAERTVWSVNEHGFVMHLPYKIVACRVC